MTGITILRNVSETGAFLVATALSCGPSQIIGSIKLLVDTYLLLASRHRQSKINFNLEEIKANWKSFKESSAAGFVAEKLGIEQSDLTQATAEYYFEAKDKKINGKIQRLTRSIKADAYALIPFIGAHLSWRIATDYKGKRFTPIFSRATEQLLENSKHMASGLLFAGRKSKGTNTSEDGGEYIEVSTSTKKRKIRIYHQLAKKRGHISAPTVVLFHPNMGRASVMSERAAFYRNRGYNTLAVTLGGYPGSPGVTTSEKSMYQDIEAVKRYLASCHVKEVAYHGYSLGTGAALQAAVGISRKNHLKTLFVVLDQPYTSAADVGYNVAGPVGKGILSAGCPVGLDVELPGQLWTKTDGLNNLRKVKLLEDKDIPLICFEADEDDFMGRNKVNGKYTENFARDLLEARYGDAPETTTHLVTLTGRHGVNSLTRTREWNSDPIPSRKIKVQQYE